MTFPPFPPLIKRYKMNNGGNVVKELLLYFLLILLLWIGHDYSFFINLYYRPIHKEEIENKK